MKRVGVPYVAGVSEPIRRILRPLEIEVVHKPKPWQWSLCRPFKDSVPPENQKGVVYEVPCKDCGATYTGETLRTIEHRLKEHKRSTEKGDFTSSAVAEHAWQ